MSLVKGTGNPQGLPSKETEPFPSEETVYSRLLANAFAQIGHELDTNGTTRNLDALRRIHLEFILGYWQEVLQMYTKACEDKGIAQYSGEEIQIGNDRVKISAIDAGYVEDGTRLEIESNSPNSKDTLSIIRVKNGQVDAVFLPELKSSTTNEDGTELNYFLRFADGKIFYMRRAFLRPGMVADERTMEFSRFSELSQSK